MGRKEPAGGGSAAQGRRHLIEEPSVALLGLSPALLEWGLRCAERNVALSGIYDPDHRAALMASLRLACSAFPDPREAIGTATVVLLGQPCVQPDERAAYVSLGFALTGATRIDALGTPAFGPEPVAALLARLG